MELLQRGTGATAEENPTTIVITIDHSSQIDGTQVREQTVEVLEAYQFENTAIEIGRGSIYRSAQKDTRSLPNDAYLTEARMGTSIGPRGSLPSAGTFGGYVRIRSFDADDWKTFGLTCHHVVLPDSINHPMNDKFNKHGIHFRG